MKQNVGPGLASGRAGVLLMQRSDSAELGRLIVQVGQDRDRAAFARLFAHFAPRLKTYLMRAGANPVVAEDFAQEAMLTVWRKAALFDPARAGASTWIFTIARNLRIDAARREKLDQREPDITELPDNPEQPDEVLSGIDDTVRVSAALSALSADQSHIIKLSYFHEKAHAEIARELGIPLGTVKSRLRLAMIRLRGLLSEMQ